MHTRVESCWSSRSGLFVAAYELELVDESRPIAHLLRVEISVDAGRDAIGEQVEYEYARHVRVLRVNARLLLGRAYLAHVLGVLVEIGLVAQTLGYPVDAARLVARRCIATIRAVVGVGVGRRHARVDGYGAVVEGLGTLAQCFALETLGDGGRRAHEQLVHLAHVAGAGAGRQARRRRVLAQQLGGWTWRRRRREQRSSNSSRRRTGHLAVVELVV